MQIFSYLSPILDRYVSLMDFLGHGKVFDKHLVSCHRKVNHQFMHQPLIWNPLFTDEVACVLGLRPRFSWAAMDNGPTHTVADWIKFL